MADMPTTRQEHIDRAWQLVQHIEGSWEATADLSPTGAAMLAVAHLLLAEVSDEPETIAYAHGGESYDRDAPPGGEVGPDVLGSRPGAEPGRRVLPNGGE